MKRIAQLLAPFLLTFSLAGGVAAASSCSISNTGPDSVNVCKNTTTNDVTITCTNKADVVFVNGQNSGSGSATVSGNTSGGSASSGTAGNINFNSVTAKLSCAPAKQASITPPAGGQGGGQIAQSTPAAKAPAAVNALPTTGANTSAVIAGVATTIFAGTALAFRFGASAYRKLF